jgi:hypothetical protein
VPVLVLAGREDLRTPLEDARRSAARYPGARVLAVPDVGHSVLGSDLSGCALAGLAAFLGGQPVANCPRGRRRPIDAAAVIPADAADLRPAPGLRGRTGRTATAVGATVYGVERATLGAVAGLLVPADRAVRVPGLRGGLAVRRGRTLHLRAVEWVRGVIVSGQISHRAARLVIAGPEAAAGALARGRGQALRGTLGGARVTVRPPPAGLRRAAATRVQRRRA